MPVTMIDSNNILAMSAIVMCLTWLGFVVDVAGKGWHSMVSPAVMTGIFCHIVGNFVGITVATLLK
jgi:hypothetical protein